MLLIIYADILVLVNLYIDYFILLAVKRFLHLQVKPIRMFLGAAAGGISGLSALVTLPSALHWIILILCGAGVCFVTFFKGNLRMLFKSIICFISFSLIFSGLIALLTQFFSINAAVIRGRVYFNISPPVLLVFTIISYMISELIERIKGRKAPDSMFCKIVVEGNGEKSELLTKIDTGNSLCEPFSGLPVVVVTKKSVEKVLPIQIDDYLKNGQAQGGFRLVPFSTVGGGGLLPAFKADCVYIKGSEKYLNCYVAVFGGELSASGYSALINPEALESA